MEIKLELPIYATKTIGRKKDNKKIKTFLLSMNWYNVAHYQEKNHIKQYYNKLVADILKERVNTRFNGKIRVSYKLYYKNSASDMMNIVSIIDKFFLDALQELKIIEDDNVLNYRECKIEVAGQDKERPRVEIVVRDCKE